MNKALLLLYIVCALPAHAVTIERPLRDPGNEARAQALFHQLRCVVCEGQPLSESDAPLALDMRKTIRDMIQQGQDEQAIIAHFTMRYGDAILLRPPANRYTWLLWAMPAILLVGGGLTLYRHFRRPHA
jgi:cytochrome c-type biogenesis protein CcmH